MRAAEANHLRENARRDREDLELALAMSRSMSEAPPERPGEAAAAAGRAAAARATAARPTRLQPLQRPQLPPTSAGGAGGAVARGLGAASCGGGRALPPPPGMRQTCAHSADFDAAVEMRLQEWSTQMYAQNPHLHEIGRTAREEQRDRVRDQLKREWASQRLPVYDMGYARSFEGGGQRLGGGRDGGMRTAQGQGRRRPGS